MNQQREYKKHNFHNQNYYRYTYLWQYINRKMLLKYTMLLTYTYCLSFSPIQARADMFGGDVALLTRMLMQSIKQLHELRQIVSTAKAEIHMLQNIHKGINDSLHLLQELNPELDPGILKELKNSDSALRQIEKLYGKSKNFKNSDIFKINDNTIAEAISLNNNLFENSRITEQIGQDIKNFSHQVSPGGAQKLTAQSLGVLIQTENNNLRAQAKSLKLQAQTLARLNKKDKENEKFASRSLYEINQAMKKQSTQEKFKIPRF